jgi:hypothetical protein
MFALSSLVGFEDNIGEWNDSYMSGISAGPPERRCNALVHTATGRLAAVRVRKTAGDPSVAAVRLRTTAGDPRVAAVRLRKTAATRESRAYGEVRLPSEVSERVYDAGRMAILQGSSPDGGGRRAILREWPVYVCVRV